MNRLKGRPQTRGAVRTSAALTGSDRTPTTDGVPVAPARSRPATQPLHSQDEQRHRRRHLLRITYDRRFDLGAEIAAICDPLAARIAAHHRPVTFRRYADELADAVHELVSTVTGWSARPEAERRTAHLAAEPGKRARAMTLLIDTEPRPALPDMTEDDLASGAWAAKLAAMAEVVTPALAVLLDRARPPEVPALRGQPALSDQLAALLRETVDRAAVNLSARLDRAAVFPVPVENPGPAEAAKAELAALGVTD